VILHGYQRGVTTRICVVSSEYPPKWGGVGVVAYYLSTWMAKRGHEVHVVTRDQRIGYKRNLENIHIHPVRWLKAPMLFTLSFGDHAVEWIKESGMDFDIVHVHSNMALLKKKHYRRIGSPVVSTMHGTWKGERSMINLRDLTFSPSTVNDLSIMYVSPLMDRFEDHALRLSNAVIVESLSECRALRERGAVNIYGRQIRLPPGIDTEEFTPARKEDSLREDLGIPGGNRMVVSVGRWAARKGIREMISVFAGMKKARNDISFVLVGWGPLEREINRKIKNLGLENDLLVKRSLPFDRMQALVATADIAMFHSYWEGFGLTMGEALASGTPVVATAVGGIPEMVKDYSGRLVKVGDVDGEIKAGLELLERDDLAEMGRKGRKHMVEKFSWDQVSKKTEELYEWVADDPTNTNGWREGFEGCPDQNE
jgi:glycosyltransferase involved in cell wall biosynthesis